MGGIRATQDGAVGISYVYEQESEDTDWTYNTPSIEYKLPKIDLYINETTSTSLVSYTEISEGDNVRLHNNSDGIVDVTLGTVTTKLNGTTEVHDIFNDGSAVATYTLDGDTIDLGGNYDVISTDITYDTGKFNQAAKFNGSSSFFFLNYNENQPRTISLWINQYSGAGAFLGDTSVENQQTANYSNRLRISDGKLNLYYYDGSINVINGNMSINNNEFYMITFSVYYDIINIYINGILDISISASSITIGDDFNHIQIGSGVDSSLGASFFNGLIDQVRIFNKILTQEEVNILYNEDTKKYTADISSLNLTETPTSAFFNREVTVSTVTEETVNRCLALKRKKIGVL